MNIQNFRVSVFGFGAIAFASFALAGPPALMEKFEDSGGPFLDPVASANCGFEVLYTFQEKGKFTASEDGSYRLHRNSTIVFINAQTGTELIETSTLNLTGPPVLELVDEDQQTITLIYFDTYTGIPFKWLQPGTGVLLRDAGRVTINLSLVFDFDGNFISLSEEFTGVKGPHPSLFMSNSDYIALGCGALS